MKVVLRIARRGGPPDRVEVFVDWPSESVRRVLSRGELPYLLGYDTGLFADVCGLVELVANWGEARGANHPSAHRAHLEWRGGGAVFVEIDDAPPGA